MRLSTVLLLVPTVSAVTLVAVANRENVVFRLEPFSAPERAFGFTMPLFLLVYLAFFAGVLVGGVTVWLHRVRDTRRKRLAARGEAKEIGDALTSDGDKGRASSSVQ